MAEHDKINSNLHKAMDKRPSVSGQRYLRAARTFEGEPVQTQTYVAELVKALTEISDNVREEL